MKNHVVDIDRADVQSKVVGNFRAKSQYQSSMLNAMNVNQVSSFESFDQRRYLTFDQATVMKLDSWLSRVKKNQTCAEEINSEAARIKVLDIEQSSKIVTDLREYIKDFKVHADDVMSMIEN